MTLQEQYRPLLEAISFAARAHHGQTRKDGKTPYSSHVFRVCLIVRDVFGFGDPSMLTAAVLHDTIEDTTTDYDDVREIHGDEIAAWVATLTKNKSLPEEAREQDYIARLMKAPWKVRACKLADIFDNLLDIPRLPEDKRPKSLRRVSQYLAALENSKEPELHAPLKIVRQLLGEIS